GLLGGFVGGRVHENGIDGEVAEPVRTVFVVVERRELQHRIGAFVTGLLAVAPKGVVPGADGGASVGPDPVGAVPGENVVGDARTAFADDHARAQIADEVAIDHGHVAAQARENTRIIAFEKAVMDEEPRPIRGDGLMGSAENAESDFGRPGLMAGKPDPVPSHRPGPGIVGFEENGLALAAQSIEGSLGPDARIGRVGPVLLGIGVLVRWAGTRLGETDYDAGTDA